MRKVICILLLFIILPGCKKEPNDYNHTRDECISIFQNNKESLSSIAEKAIEQKSDKDLSFSKVSSISYNDNYDGLYVDFSVDAQGMLGGQYWGIIYSPSDEFPNWANKLYNKIGFYKEESDNNRFFCERIESNWFFYYLDYDGNRHGLSWVEEQSDDNVSS